jgi:hypothetical protein
VPEPGFTKPSLTMSWRSFASYKQKPRPATWPSGASFLLHRLTGCFAQLVRQPAEFGFRLRTRSRAITDRQEFNDLVCVFDTHLRFRLLYRLRIPPTLITIRLVQFHGDPGNGHVILVLIDVGQSRLLAPAPGISLPAALSSTPT